jgi:probable FeS assembly SUF system protein SufT
LTWISRGGNRCGDNGAVSTSGRNSEPVALARDCAATAVPVGTPTLLPAGQLGYLTQSLGGSFTVLVDGNLYRIAGDDADAIGKPPPVPLQLDADAGEADVEALVRSQLATCYDPEIPVNIVDLGLVYVLELLQRDDGRYRVHVVMTLTAPGCGMGEILVDDARARLGIVPRVAEVDVELTFDPPWRADMMSDAARLETGMW